MSRYDINRYAPAANATLQPHMVSTHCANVDGVKNYNTSNKEFSMKIFKTLACSLSLLAALSLHFVPALAMSNSSTVIAGFTDLPLRNCQGTYCGELKKLAFGQEMRVIFNDTGGGWSYVEVVQTGDKGWVCNANVF